MFEVYKQIAHLSYHSELRVSHDHKHTEPTVASNLWLQTKKLYTGTFLVQSRLELFVTSAGCDKAATNLHSGLLVVRCGKTHWTIQIQICRHISCAGRISVIIGRIEKRFSPTERACSWLKLGFFDKSSCENWLIWLYPNSSHCMCPFFKMNRFKFLRFNHSLKLFRLSKIIKTFLDISNCF